jgi:hypothetical protein
MTSVSHRDMYSIAPKTRSIKASSLFSITEPSQSYRSLFPSPYTPFREICTEQQKRNILEVFHDAEPGSEIDPIVRQPATHPQACGLVCISEGMSRRSHNHARAIASHFWNWLYRLRHNKSVFKTLPCKCPLQAAWKFRCDCPDNHAVTRSSCCWLKGS